MCLDYADKLAASSAVRRFDPRHQLREIVNDLRNLGVEYNIAVASVSQANRNSVRDGRITEVGIAESYAKVEAADVIIAQNNPTAQVEASNASPTEVSPDDNEFNEPVSNVRVLSKVVNILKNRDYPVYDGDIPIYIIPDIMLISDNQSLLPIEFFTGRREYAG